jgi:hypothetical protein
MTFDMTLEEYRNPQSTGKLLILLLLRRRQPGFSAKNADFFVHFSATLDSGSLNSRRGFC